MGYQQPIEILLLRSAEERMNNSGAGSTSAGTGTPVRLGLLGGFRLWIEAEALSLPMNAQRLVCFLAI
ncbi:MAG: hypothetical protein ACXVEY_11190, partial [Actinomycetota bacterium]